MLLAYQIANCVPVGPGSERDVSTRPANIWSVTTKSVASPYILRDTDGTLGLALACL